MKPRHIAELAALALICWSMTSCAFTVSPDGSKSATLDGDAIIAILADK